MPEIGERRTKGDETREWTGRAWRRVSPEASAPTPTTTPEKGPSRPATTTPAAAPAHRPSPAEEYATGLIANIPGSALNLGKNLLQLPFTLEKITPENILDVAGTVGRDYWDRYGGLGKIAQTAHDDPVGALIDVATAGSLGGGALGRLGTVSRVANAAPRTAATLARVGDTMGAVSRAVNPAEWAGKIASAAGRGGAGLVLRPSAEVRAIPPPEVTPPAVPVKKGPFARAGAVTRSARQGVRGSMQAVGKTGALSPEGAGRAVNAAEAALDPVLKKTPNLSATGVRNAITNPEGPAGRLSVTMTPEEHAALGTYGRVRGIAIPGFDLLTPGTAWELYKQARENAGRLATEAPHSTAAVYERGTAQELERALRRANPELGPLMTTAQNAMTADQTLAGAAGRASGLGVPWWLATLGGSGVGYLSGGSPGLAAGAAVMGLLGKAAQSPVAGAGLAIAGEQVGRALPRVGPVAQAVGRDPTQEALAEELRRRNLQEVPAVFGR